MIAALALVCVDNPMCPGTGHRICNDCMKACVFQKQEPVNIPQIETRGAHRGAAPPVGVRESTASSRGGTRSTSSARTPRPYNGQERARRRPRPRGLHAAHHLRARASPCVGVDGLKIEPLPRAALDRRRTRTRPRPVRDFATMYARARRARPARVRRRERVRHHRPLGQELPHGPLRDPRRGSALLRMYGGVRFGGTLDARGRVGARLRPRRHRRGRRAADRSSPSRTTSSRGIRKASDFLMALQLTGAYKQSSIANLQVRLPAVVIGGGLTAIDTATELLAYYVVQVEKTAERIDDARRASAARRRASGDVRRGGAGVPRRAARPRARARATSGRSRRRRGARPLPALLDAWGGVSLVYRKRARRLPRVPAQPRGGHQDPRGGRALHREPRAGRGPARRARRT